MAFDSNELEWDKFLSAWPMSRLSAMTLEEYAASGNKDCFIHWLEFRLGGLGSVAGGSAFKFGIFARGNNAPKESDSDHAYDDKYGWYAKLGQTPHEAFEKVRGYVVAAAEASARDDLEAIDQVPLGTVYRWKIAFLYQSRLTPKIACVFLPKPLRSFLGLPLNDSRAQSQLYRELALQKLPGEGIVEFSKRLWKDWVYSHPCKVILTVGAIKNGNLQLNLVSAPFPESMYGDASGEIPGETALFRTDTGEQFVSDLRVPGAGGSGRLRHRLGSYYKEIQAIPGDAVLIAPQDDGSYQISHSPGNMPTAPTLPAATTQTTTKETTVPATRATAPKNLIMFGPPGTGKTYATIDEALKLLDPGLVVETEDDNEDGRARRKDRFDELVKSKRIRFVTFHQSFSYEDFVEGLRAETDNGRIQYRVVPGIFREICEDARGASKLAASVGVREGARIWKLSIDGTGPSSTRDYCLTHGQARIGWGHLGNLLDEGLEDTTEYKHLGKNDRRSVTEFSRVIQKGDVLACIRSTSELQALGVVTGDYFFDQAPPSSVLPDFQHVLPVRWLATELTLDIRELNDGTGLTLRSVYPLKRVRWPQLVDTLAKRGIALANETEADSTFPTLAKADHDREDYVLIIDEINRGNVARIFGELITLIEPSKRDGQLERLEVQLPYSKDLFSVPSNVHLIGTMNTADRSLTGLDVALRRRFDFIPMPPRPELLTLPLIEGIDVRRTLETINRRIEVLLGHDHQIGHAYFMHLQVADGLPGLSQIFRNKIVPLLQEYFFDDWQRIAWVLNDHRKPNAYRFVIQAASDIRQLFGEATGLSQEVSLWQINPEAFNRAESYQQITAEAHG